MATRVKRYVLRSLAGLGTLAVCIVGAAVLWRLSAQASVSAARPAIGAQGVNELFHAQVGGIEQWMHIRGVDRNNPVLLYLHGGPGTPMMPFSHMFQNEMERDFIVVQWDQRGAGKTYFANPAADLPATVDYDRMVADALEVVQFLKQRFQREKIFVLGHSWGSMLGVGLVQQHPEHFYAYVGTGQVVDCTKNEQLGYQATLTEARNRHDALATAELEAIAPYPEADGTQPESKNDVLRKWQQTFGIGPSRRYRGELQDIMVENALRSPEYGWRDITYFTGVDGDALWPKLSKAVEQFKANRWGGTFRVPVILILGRHDWQTPSTLAAEWFDTLQAPGKHIVWLEESAHSPMVDEPGRFAAALHAIVRPLARDGVLADHSAGSTDAP